jgi:transposase
LSLIAAGGVAAQVAKQLGKSGNWISETVHRYNAGGAAGVKNKSKNQSSKTLTEEQVKELEKEIESGRAQAGRLWSSTQIKR